MNLLTEGFCPGDVAGCSGSAFTRQVGNEQPSPKLQKQNVKHRQWDHRTLTLILVVQLNNGWYLEKIGRSQYFFSSPNTWRKFLYAPKLKPFLSVPCWNAGALNASDRRNETFIYCPTYFILNTKYKAWHKK